MFVEWTNAHNSPLKKVYYLFYTYGNKPEKLSNFPEALWQPATSFLPVQCRHQRIFTKAQAAPLPLPPFWEPLSPVALEHLPLGHLFQLLVTPPRRGDFSSSLGPMGLS